MAGKARFPGKSQNKNPGKLRLSYKDIGGAPLNDGYNAIVAATATNLRAFRTLFNADEDDNIDFVGFEVKDPLVAKCKKTCLLLRKEENALNHVPSNGKQVKDISSPDLNSINHVSSKKTTIQLSPDLNSASDLNNTVCISSADENPTSSSNVSKSKSKLNSNIVVNQLETKIKKPPATVAVTKQLQGISPQVEKLNGTSSNSSHNTNSIITPDSIKSSKIQAKSSISKPLVPETSTRSARIIKPNKKFMTDETISEKPVSKKRPQSETSPSKSTTSEKANKDAITPNVVAVSQSQPLGNGVVTSPKSKNLSNSVVSVNANQVSREHNPAKLDVSPARNLNTSLIPAPVNATVGNFKEEALKEKLIDKEQEKLYANRPELAGACIVPFDAKQSKPANGTVQNMEGIIVCGACRKIRHFKIPVSNCRWGIFLCDRCYIQFSKLMVDFDKLQLLFCSTDEGTCLSEPEKILLNADCCNACFAKFCLLSMDLPETTYLKLWNCLPDILRPSVPLRPTNNFKQYPNRGKIVYVNKTGSIVSASPVSLRSLRKVTPWDTGVRTNTSSVKSLSFSDSLLVEVTPADRQVKRLLPNDDLNFKRVKGARVKQASHRSGIPPQLPVATFKDLCTLPSTSAGFLKSGKFSFCTEQENNSRRDLGADEEILFGRQKGPVRERIRTLVPFEMESVEDHGFPVVVTGSFPPKPLCFLCGSAGIQQLIYCTQCCEPYHPFCAGDDTLMSYAIKTIPSRNSQIVATKKQEVDSNPTSSTEKKDASNSNALLNSASSLLSPPLTPLHFLPEEQLTETNDCDDMEDSEIDDEMKQHVLAWTCQRCIICKSCGLNTKEQPNGTKEREFIKCVQCRDPYHLACVDKKVATAVKKEESVSWSCTQCCKCRSCGKNLEGNRQSHNVEVSVEDGGEESWTGRKSNLLLCIECFKKRQDGSFCPVCQVCYDENDYETKMMECAKCQRWIHATCESISNEQYQILGTLPECIEYICKVCDKGNSVWRRALEMDMINGCERVLRIFQKKVVTSSRKRKSLTFDLPTDAIYEEASIKNDNGIENIELQTDRCLETLPSPNKLCKVTPNCLESLTKPSCTENAPSPVKLTEDNKQDQIITIEKNGVLINLKPCNVVLNSEEVSNMQKSDLTTLQKAAVNPFKLKSCSVVVVPLESNPFASKIRCKSPLSLVTPIDEMNLNSPAVALNLNTPDVALNLSTPDVALNLSTPDVALNLNTPALALNLNIPTDVLNLNTPAEQILCTPQKMNSSLIEISTPSKLYTPSKRVTLVVDRIKNIGGCFKSIQLFRKMGHKHLQEYFEEESEFDQSKIESMLQAFESAVKEVFPWLELDEFKQATESEDLSTIYFEPGSMESDNTKRLGLVDNKISMCINKDGNPFSDNYWDKEDCEDERQCSFCGEKGDFPPDSCGRLLWAGMNEWVHTNCTLWSSEVWEEEDGALQQVGSALLRSKHSKCVYCDKKGASVSCCHSACHDSYHFLCAINAKCALLEDKTLFCPPHRSSAKGNIQQEMEVMRKVFVDPEWLKKKDCLGWSSDVRVCIGSLRIERLGYVTPISAMNIVDSDNILVPLEFQCYRLYWSHVNPSEKVLYSFRTEIDQGGFVFPNMSSEGGCADEGVNITVDHSRPPEIIRKKLSQVKEFHNWIENSPRYYDEYNIEWTQTCPLDFSDTPDFSLEDIYGNMFSYESPESTLISAMSLDDNGSDTTISDYEDDTEDDLISVEKENLFEQPSSSEKVGEKENLFEQPSSSEKVGEKEKLPDKYVVNVTPKKTAQVDSKLNEKNSNSITKACGGRVTRSSARTAMDCIMIPQLDGAYDDDDTSESESIESEEESEEEEGEDEDEEENESSEDNSESKDSTEEDTSDEDEQSLTDSYRKSIRTTRQTISNSKALTQRTLRSRVKQPKLEVRKEIHKCPACKKPFQSKSSVNKHIRFCKLKKTRKVSITKQENTNKSVAVSSKSKSIPSRKITRSRKSVTPKKSERKSSRSKPSINKASLRKKSSGKATKRQEPASKASTKSKKEEESLSSSSSANDSDSEPQTSSTQKLNVEKVKEIPISAASDSSQQQQDTNYDDDKDENKSADDKIIICASQEEKPVKCDTCHMTYRTSIGFEKHLAFCVAYSSTTEEEETDNSNGGVTPPSGPSAESSTAVPSVACTQVVQEEVKTVPITASETQNVETVPITASETQNVESSAIPVEENIVSEESSESDSIDACTEDKRLPVETTTEIANGSSQVDPMSESNSSNLPQDEEELYIDETEQQLEKCENKEEIVVEEEEMEEEEHEIVKQSDTELIDLEPEEEEQTNINNELIDNTLKVSETLIPNVHTNESIAAVHLESKLHSFPPQFQQQPPSLGLLPGVESHSSVMPVQSIQVPLPSTGTTSDLYNVHHHQGAVSVPSVPEAPISPVPLPPSLPPPIHSQTYQPPEQMNLLNKEYNNPQSTFLFPQVTNQTLAHSVPIAHPVPNTPAAATYPSHEHQHHSQQHPPPPQIQQQPEIFPIPNVYNMSQNSPHGRQQNIFVSASPDTKNLPSAPSPLQQQQNNFLAQSSSDLHSQQLLRDFAAIQQSISSNTIPNTNVNNVGRAENSPVIPGASMDFHRRIHPQHQQQQHQHSHSISVIPQQLQQPQPPPAAATPPQYHTITIQDSNGQLMTIQVPISNQQQTAQQSHQHVQEQPTQQQSIQQSNNLNMQQLQFQLQQQQQQQQHPLVLQQQQQQGQLALQQQQQQQQGQLVLQQQGQLALQQQQGQLALQQQQGQLSLQQQQGQLALQQQQGQLALQQQQQHEHMQQPQEGQLTLQQQQMAIQQGQQQGQSLQLVLQQQLALQQAQQQQQQQQQTQQQQYQHMHPSQQYGGIPQYRQDVFSQLSSNSQQIHVEQQRYSSTPGGGQSQNSQPQQHPSSIGFQNQTSSPQQAQTITDGNGTTYYIMQQGNNFSTIPLNQSQLSQVISQMPQQQLQQQQHQQQIPGGIITAVATGSGQSHQHNFSASQFHHNPNCPAARPVPEILQCIANVVQPESKNAMQQQQITEHYNAGSLSNMTVNSPGSAHPCPCPRCLTRAHSLLGEEKYEKLAVIPKIPPSRFGAKTWTTIAKRSPGKNNKGNGLDKKNMRPLGMNFPKLLPATVVNTGTVASSSCVVSSGSTESILCQALGKAPVSSPNIAVVRPMEHPLQKMADQVSQMENSFNTSTLVSPAPLLVSGQLSQSPSQIIPVNENSPGMQIQQQQTSQGLNSPQQSQGRTVVVRKRTEGSTNTAAAVKNSNSKPIKMVLTRKELGDSYSIKDFKGGNSATDGAMRSLKIKGRIVTGLQSGKLSDVVVTPKVTFVPTPDPDSENESNLTIAEEQSLSDDAAASSSSATTTEGQSSRSGMRLTRRAVVVYEVTCTDTSQVYRSSDVRAVWSHIFEVVQGRRQNYNLPPLSYPEQRITLSDKQGEPEGFNKWGLTHRAVQFLLEQLPGNKSVNHQFRFHNPPTSGEDSPVPLNESGCARTETYPGRKPFDMFGWLASKHRQPPSTFQNPEASKGQGLPLAMRFRNLREKSKSILTVYWSAIHGRGLYTRRDIEKGEMIIEYAGEVVRSLVCEEREKYYESKGMGCYQFRVDAEYVVDATMKGNAARFINHSCEPNCESKTIKILGNMHILIFAMRRINAGEELTYDYKFPYEDEDKKIPCTCASKKCRKYLN